MLDLEGKIPNVFLYIAMPISCFDQNTVKCLLHALLLFTFVAFFSSTPPIDGLTCHLLLKLMSGSAILFYSINQGQGLRVDLPFKGMNMHSPHGSLETLEKIPYKNSVKVLFNKCMKSKQRHPAALTK